MSIKYINGLKILVISAVGFFFASQLNAQEIPSPASEVSLSLSSYDDLLNRVSRLEEELSQKPATAPVYTSTRRDDGTRTSEGGYFTNYEYLFLTPVYSNATAFYIHDTLAPISDAATLREFDFDLQSSHRFELGYLSPSTNLGWRTRYWFFDGNATEVSPTDVDVKVGVADDPDIGIDDVVGDGTSLIARAETEMNVFDLEAISRHQIYYNMVELSAGLRMADVQHHYLARHSDNNGESLTADNNFKGLGPTIALMTRRNIGYSNWGLDLQARGSLLFGNADAQWSRLDSSGTVGDRIVHDGDLRIIPVAETRMGVDYRRCYGRYLLELGTGVEGQVWINGGTPLSAGQDSASDSSNITSPFSEDLGFIGGYLRASVKY